MRQVGKACHAAQPTVHRWVNLGIRGHVLPSFRIGGRRFILKKDLERFLNLIQGVAHVS
jgi:hypothetical protein